MIIDPPSPFASLEEWARYIAELEALTPAEEDKAEVSEALASARDYLRQKAGL